MWRKKCLVSKNEIFFVKWKNWKFNKNEINLFLKISNENYYFFLLKIKKTSGFNFFPKMIFLNEKIWKKIVQAASLIFVTVMEAADTSTTVRLLSSYRATMNCKTF